LLFLLRFGGAAVIQQIILADDREIYRMGVVELFSHHNQFQIVADMSAGVKIDHIAPRKRRDVAE
jgi:DNA-binding NarL/FixJ family response regulator